MTKEPEAHQGKGREPSVGPFDGQEVLTPPPSPQLHLGCACGMLELGPSLKQAESKGEECRCCPSEALGERGRMEGRPPPAGLSSWEPIFGGGMVCSRG